MVWLHDFLARVAGGRISRFGRGWGRWVWLVSRFVGKEMTSKLFVVVCCPLHL